MTYIPDDNKISKHPKTKRTFSKIVITILIFVATALLLLLALLPPLASTKWGKEELTKFVNAQIPGRIFIENLSLSWLGPQEVNGFILKDPKGAIILNLKKGTIDATLFELFVHKLAAGEIDVESLTGLFVADISGKTNLEKALVKDCCPKKQREEANAVSAAYNIANGKVNFDSRHQKPLKISLQGETYQENIKGTFTINAQLTGVDFEHLIHADPELLHSTPGAELKAQAEINNLPVALLDQFLALKIPRLAGILRELVGQRLNLTLKQTASQHEAIFVLKAESSQINMDLEAGISNRFSIRKPGKISVKITPALIEKLAAAEGIDTAWHLLNPAPVDILINSLQFPMSQLEDKTLDEFDLSQVGIEAKLSLQDVSAKGGASLGMIDIQNLTAMIESLADSTTGKLTLTGNAAHNGAPFKLDFKALITKPRRWADFTNDWRRYVRVDGGLRDIPVASFDSHLGMEGRLLQLLGKRADIAVSMYKDQDTPLAALAFQSDYIKIPSLILSIGDDIVLKKPVEATVHLSPELINKVLAENADTLSFSQHSPAASIKINNFSMPFPSREAALPAHRFSLGAEVAVSPLIISNVPGIGAFSLHDIVLNINGQSLSTMQCSAMCSFSHMAKQGLLRQAQGNLQGSFDPQSRNVKVNFSGLTLLGDHQDEGQFSGEAVMENWLSQDNNIDLKQAIVHINAKTHNLPTTVLGALDRQMDLVALLGEAIDAHIAGDIALANSQGVLTLGLHSALFNGSASLKLDHGISLHHSVTPASFDLLLTPEGYAALRNRIKEETPKNFTLAEPARINIQLAKLDIPWEAFSAIGLPYWRSAVDMNIAVAKVEAIDLTTQHTITLNEVNARLTSQDISQHTSFEMQSSGKTSYGITTAVTLFGVLEKGFSSNGSLNKQDLSLTLDASVENLPVPLICQLACLDPEITQKVDAVIGNSLNAKIKARLQQMSGPIYVEFNGINGHTILDAQLTDGILTLNKDFFAELKVTPQLGKYVLQDLIPFLSGVIASDQPLKLAISRENFSLPLGQTSLTDISIAGASLELGKMRFTNQGQLAKVLSLLTTSEANEITVWLTPAYFSFAAGTFKLERVDMLISDRYPIAAWGKVDIPQDSVNMVIGLSGAAIRKAFGVSSNIRKNYMLQLPFKGSISNASIDKSKAVGRLSALVAQSQGGPHGLVIGTVLDIATGGLTEEKPPEATTKPLPWEAMMQESPESDSDNSNVPDKVEKAVPIEEIGKGAGKLLKKLFK